MNAVSKSYSAAAVAAMAGTALHGLNTGLVSNDHPHLLTTATDGGPPTSANQCRTPSIRCAWPHGLELLAGRPPRTAGLRVLQTGSENLAFFQILACPAH